MIAIDQERLRSSFERYAAIGATENGGLHRLTLSEPDRTARDQFCDDLEELGLDVTVDRIGNVFGRRPGTEDVPPVVIGSHLDSQPYGGRYDGQLGVLAALETVRSLEDEGLATERPIEVVDWTNEEGVRFQPSLLGSRTVAGEFEYDDVLERTDDEGITIREALDRSGYRGDADYREPEWASYLELHIEQGPRLADADIPIGVVTGTFGKVAIGIEIVGESDHAATPMHERTPVLNGVTEALSRVQSLPNRIAREGMVTVGQIDAHPGSINTIPETVTFTVDFRWVGDRSATEIVDWIRTDMETVSSAYGLGCDLTVLGTRNPDEFSEAVRRSIKAAADERGIPYRTMYSMAGHDARSVNQVADSGMIFVPSVGGRSHCEEEYTRWEDCVAGVGVFATATVNVARPV